MKFCNKRNFAINGQVYLNLSEVKAFFDFFHQYFKLFVLEKELS